MPDLPVAAPDPAALRERYIGHSHSGNGTGCRCCELVDDGILAALLAERQQDKERIERLEEALDALAPTRPSRGYRPGLDDPALADKEEAE